MPWKTPDERAPFVDLETGGTIVVGYPADDIRLDISPMIYNDRIVVTKKEDYPKTVIAGFCFDKGGAAIVAATWWLDHWDELDEPLGHKKVAFNAMPQRIGKGTA